MHAGHACLQLSADLSLAQQFSYLQLPQPQKSKIRNFEALGAPSPAGMPDALSRG